MNATLTTRYIDAAITSLPQHMQADVEQELRALIADATDGRIDAGEGQGLAERAVLTELGDPAILAASYADRPLHLVGPKYYLTWLRLLKLLLIIIPLCAGLGVALAQSLTGAGIGVIIGETIAVIISAIVHTAFWVTVVFVILERTGAETGTTWSVDDLPEPETPASSRVGLIASLVLLGVAAGALLWDRFIGLAWITGERLSVLNPDLWPWWMAALFALIAAEALFAIALYVRGRWTMRLAVGNTMLATLFVSWVLTLLGREQLISTEFIDRVLLSNGTDESTVQILGVILAFVASGIAVWDTIDGWVRLGKTRGSEPVSE